MLQAELTVQQQDREAAPEVLKWQRRLAWLQAYQREVMDGPNEYRDLFSGADQGGGGSGRASYRGARGGRGKARAAAGTSSS